MQESLEVGTVVFSIAGRDQGRFFMVYEILDDTYVKLVDGSLRPIEKPKRKKIKHIKSQGLVLEKIAEKLRDNKVIYDAELKSALRTFNS